MPEFGQYQQQSVVQLQRLSPQQYMLAKLLELPIADLEQRVRDEVYENVALEEGGSHPSDEAMNDSPSDGKSDEFDTSDGGDFSDSADKTDEFDSREDYSVSDSSDDNYSSSSVYDYDDLPTYAGSSSRQLDTEIPIGDTRSFIEDLEAQIADYDVDEHQRLLISYLIGSLDDRGYIDRPLRSISDDLLFNHNIDATETELEQALHTLQQFEPIGIGARNLQECLMLQLEHQIQLLDDNKGNSGNTVNSRLPLLNDALTIIKDYYNLFQRNDVDRLADATGMSADHLRKVLALISKLNPQPGRSLHEAADDRIQTVIPDFIIETDHESNVSFYVNNGEVPPLHVSREYLDQLKSYQSSPATMNRSQREAFLYTKQKVESAQMFINAMRQRHNTLYSTMRAIIEFQRAFMLTQDDLLLQPLRLADVAKRASLDVSTISRVVSSKYALLDGVLFPLKHFFLRTKTSASGHAVAKNKVAHLLRDIIDSENKRSPLTDEQISALMTERGEPISRRTVSKYRDSLGIPSAVMRKKI